MSGRSKSKAFIAPRSRKDSSVLVKVKLPNGEREVRVTVKSNRGN